jgi:hypothetical protein
MLKSTHRRSLFFARKMWHPEMSAYAYEYAVKMRPWHRDHTKLLRVAAIAFLVALVFGIESTTRAQQLYHPPAAPPPTQMHDTGERGDPLTRAWKKVHKPAIKKARAVPVKVCTDYEVPDPPAMCSPDGPCDYSVQEGRCTKWN